MNQFRFIKNPTFSNLKYIIVFICCYLQLGSLIGQTATTNSNFTKNAQLILTHYESNAYQLNPSKASHMGLRLWRNYKDSKYRYLLLQGIINNSKGLDKIAKSGLNSESIAKYSAKKNAAYKAKTAKTKLRKKTLEKYPNYILMATKILRNVARLDELGLQHKKDASFRKLLANYDFQKVFTDPMMIKAWGAQLANQVYWLKYLGLGDYTNDFLVAVNQTYPNEKDQVINDQQFENKIYTLTHIIIAASGYYQHSLDYAEYAPIIDYFRNNVDQICHRTKEDVIIEVGLSMLLMNQAFPEIQQIQTYINDKVAVEKRMILSKSGKADFAQGEHRNIIAVLLLDWQGCSNLPNRNSIKKISAYFPANLNFKAVKVDNSIATE